MPKFSFESLIVSHSPFHMASRAITLPMVPSNAQESLLLHVFSAKCGNLHPLPQTVLVRRRQLPAGDIEQWSLQQSHYENAYWLLSNGSRYRSLCFCCVCEAMICGNGGNLKGHMESHGPKSMTLTEEDVQKAYLLFLVRHNLPSSTSCDPMLRMMCPSMTYGRLLNLLETTSERVKSAIIEEARGKPLSVMVDGWSDMSLRRFLGIGLSIFDPATRKHSSWTLVIR